MALLMPMPWAILSIGSNLGDPVRNCRQGLHALCADTTICIESRSPFYWTEPVDYTAQQWFLNAAIKIRTALAPLDLLARLQGIQQTMGRKAQAVRFGPRVLDLDIIFYQELILETPELQIPHPRMHKRRFVLQPICDIDPDIRHPVLGLNVISLLNQLDNDEQKIIPCLSDFYS